MDNKNPSPCQEKNNLFKSKILFSNYFFFFVAFLVVFFALGCFIPQAMTFSPPSSFLDIDLFIPFNLIFVKNFLVDAKPIANEGKSRSSRSILL
jgi:hypothetical protein